MDQKIIFTAIKEGLHLSVNLAVAIGKDRGSGLFIAYCPFFCHSVQGKTYEDAKKSIHDFVYSEFCGALEDTPLFDLFEKYNFEGEFNFKHSYETVHMMSDDMNCEDITADLIVIDEKMDFKDKVK